MTLVVDSSAILAILLDEPEAERFFTIIDSADVAVLSAGNMIEISRVAQSKGRIRLEEADLLMTQLLVDIAPVDAAQVALAREGMERFGKGRGAVPAVLDFGDLFACALAQSLAAPLLFKDDDFGQTDIEPAWRR